MKKLITLFVAASLFCSVFAKGAKEPKKIKINDSKLHQLSYVTKLAQDMNMQTVELENSNTDFIAINEEAKTFVVSTIIDFSDVKIKFGCVLDEEGNLISKTQLRMKDSEIEGYLKEFGTKIQFLDSANYTLTDYGVILMTCVAAYYRALIMNNLQALHEFVPQNILERNSKIMAYDLQNLQEGDFDSIMNILAEYNK